MLRIFILLSLSVVLCSCLNNGLGLTPAMGYNTWNDFRCDNITSLTIKAAADAIIRQGLDKLGYVYVNIDDCWAKHRDSSGVIVPDPVAFPDGMKAVADYVHAKGLKFGIYTDRGLLTCAGRPGSWDHEDIDAQTYASWGIDYLKEDSCFAIDTKFIAFREYSYMRDALNKTGRPIYFSLCGWHNWYADGGATLGNSWRIAADCNRWTDVIYAINTNAPLYKYAGPGAWNDPDMLIGTNNKAAAYLTVDQSRTMFSMWCVMAAPLLIGSSILELNADDYKTYSNIELIKVNQDPLGKQGRRIFGDDLKFIDTTTNVWGKELSDGSLALVFLNNGINTVNITCDPTCFGAIGILPSDVLEVRDLWLHQNIGVMKGATYTATVRPDGASVSLRFSRARRSDVINFSN